MLRIGEGSCGLVFRLGQCVHKKMKDANMDPVAMLNEIAVLRYMSSPYLVGGGEAYLDAQQCLVFRMEDGGSSLEEAMTKGQVTSTNVVLLMRQVLSGLDDLHRHGILHCDIKPANIVVGSTGAKLTDFGLAVLERKRPQDFHVFTRWYRPPELEIESPPFAYGFPADIWAAGCVFGEMLGAAFQHRAQALFGSGHSKFTSPVRGTPYQAPRWGHLSTILSVLQTLYLEQGLDKYEMLQQFDSMDMPLMLYLGTSKVTLKGAPRALVHFMLELLQPWPEMRHTANAAIAVLDAVEEPPRIARPVSPPPPPELHACMTLSRHAAMRKLQEMVLPAAGT